MWNLGVLENNAILRDKLAMFNKERVENGYPILGKRHADFVFSRGVYFRETTRMVRFRMRTVSRKLNPREIF